MNKGAQSRLVKANEFQCWEPTLGEKTSCFHGSYLINTYLSKQAFPLWCSWPISQFTRNIWQMKLTSSLDISLLFVCFSLFWSFLPLLQFSDFLKKIVLWPTPLFLILLEPQYPETFQRMGKKKLLQKDQDLGTMWNSVRVFLNMFFTKTIKRLII